jgi:hypothetical protein
MKHDTAARSVADLDDLHTQARRADDGAKVPMREIFALAKKFIDTPPSEIDALLTHIDTTPDSAPCR